MTTLADSFFAQTPVGTTAELPRAGSWLENAHVFDASAREIKARADVGVVEIVDERSQTVGDDELIVHLAFRRVR